ncbi:hypothetical protein AVEN_244768-1 [Araneus ventricosus]|uniref:Uncharacterized protein n=1 Tax=Araneus ventricosus TaxID=182803 RepID=A0A4Y2BRG6_ARAVE|nr:hypothetical protein AVEN_244768-1 [Araneus ventricosus]
MILSPLPVIISGFVCVKVAPGMVYVQPLIVIHFRKQKTHQAFDKMASGVVRVSGFPGHNMIFPPLPVIMSGLVCVKVARGMVFVDPLIVIHFRKQQTHQPFAKMAGGVVRVLNSFKIFVEISETGVEQFDVVQSEEEIWLKRSYIWIQQCQISTMCVCIRRNSSSPLHKKQEMPRRF